MILWTLNKDIISERNPGDPNTLEGRRYTLNCEGAVGDMLYLTDLDYSSSYGHNIAEVEIFREGKDQISYVVVSLDSLNQTVPNKAVTCPFFSYF